MFLKKLLLGLLPVLFLSGGLTAQVVINELLIDLPGTDEPFEFVEFAGPPGQSLDGLTYIVIGDSSGGGSGVIDFAQDLTGYALSGTGYFVMAEPVFDPVFFGMTPDLQVVLNFENSDNVTHMLVQDFTGASGDDLDTDDDGVFDVTPWSAIVDLIACIEEENPPSGTEYHYGPPTFGPVGCPSPGFAPSFLHRCPDITGPFTADLCAYGPTTTSPHMQTPGGPNDCPTCLPPTTFDAVSDCLADTVTLTWDNADTYDEINILRNGVSIDTIAGTEETYVDTTADAGFHEYVISGVCPGGAIGELLGDVLHSPYSGQTHMVYGGETGWTDGIVDSTGAILSTLIAIGETPLLIDDLTTPCIDTFAQPGNILWLMLGTYPDKHALTVDEGQKLVELQAAGVHIYIESADVWAWDDPQPFLDFDGIDNSINCPGCFTSTNPYNGDDSFTSMDGLAYAGLDLSIYQDVDYTQDYGVGGEYTDILLVTDTEAPGPNSGYIWQNNPDGNPDPAITEDAYYVGSFYDTDAPYGKVICQTWEFGGFTDNQIALLEAYIAAFDTTITPPSGFRRGDSNDDGGLDISDAVFSLSALFVPGAPSPGCDDAADANDDGTFDISDAVFVLSALFVPGSPLPPQPGSVVCGDDPSADSLGCDVYDSCL